MHAECGCALQLERFFSCGTQCRQGGKGCSFQPAPDFFWSAPVFSAPCCVRCRCHVWQQPRAGTDVDVSCSGEGVFALSLRTSRPSQSIPTSALWNIPLYIGALVCVPLSQCHARTPPLRKKQKNIIPHQINLRRVDQAFNFHTRAAGAAHRRLLVPADLPLQTPRGYRCQASNKLSSALAITSPVTSNCCDTTTALPGCADGVSDPFSPPPLCTQHARASSQYMQQGFLFRTVYIARE